MAGTTRAFPREVAELYLTGAQYICLLYVGEDNCLIKFKFTPAGSPLLPYVGGELEISFVEYRSWRDDRGFVEKDFDNVSLAVKRRCSHLVRPTKGACSHTSSLPLRYGEAGDTRGVQKKR